MSQTERVFEAARKAETKRSPLFAWMVRNHDDFAARLDREPLTWDQLAAGFNENGLRGAGDHPVTGASAWKTWQRAQQHVAKKRAGAAAKPQPKQARPVKQANQQSIFGGPAQDKPRFQLAKVREEASGED